MVDFQFKKINDFDLKLCQPLTYRKLDKKSKYILNICKDVCVYV